MIVCSKIFLACLESDSYKSKREVVITFYFMLVATWLTASIFRPLSICSTMLAMVMILLPNSVGQYILTAVVFLLLVVTMICLGRQPITEERLSFKVPFVPWLPMFSVFVNVYLMMKLSEATWVRFAVWLVLGVLVMIFLSLNKTEVLSWEKSPFEMAYCPLLRQHTYYCLASQMALLGYISYKEIKSLFKNSYHLMPQLGLELMLVELAPTCQALIPDRFTD